MTHAPGQPPRLRVDPEQPSAARVYDYFLGGTHHFAADRKAAAAALQAMPHMPQVMRANRDFLRRAVTTVARQGVEQFLDLGSGIPTVGNVHEVARTVHPAARVVYIDIEPVAVVQGRSILADDPNAAAIHADLVDAETVLADPQVRRLIDLRQPVCLLAVAVAHFIPDTERLIKALDRYHDAVPAGSYLAMSHASDEADPQNAERAQLVYNTTTSPLVLRTRSQFSTLLHGWELLEPGLTASGHWRPDAQTPAISDLASASILVAVGRKPAAGTIA
jgi:S-adenosyl methyltransferase